MTTIAIIIPIPKPVTIMSVFDEGVCVGACVDSGASSTLIAVMALEGQ